MGEVPLHGRRYKVAGLGCTTGRGQWVMNCSTLVAPENGRYLCKVSQICTMQLPVFFYTMLAVIETDRREYPHT